MWVRIKRVQSLLKSYTIRELLDQSDPSYLRHGERKNQLARPSIAKVYASTVVYQVPSSQYGKNGKLWQQKILFRDFVVLAKDKKISIEDAINYAVDSGDVTVRCSCPAFVYWAYAYMATQIGYLYGVPRENRAPQRNNTDLRGTICKHLGRVLDTIYMDKAELVAKFSALYRGVPQPWLEAIKEIPEPSKPEPPKPEDPNAV